MGQILKFTPSRCSAFDPEGTNVLAIAYEKAIEQLRGDGFTELVRDEVARRIIEAAMFGQCNPDRLCASAFASMGISEKDGYALQHWGD
jgi:hypothetical protein